MASATRRAPASAQPGKAHTRGRGAPPGAPALTWLLLALRDTLARMAAVYAAGYLLFAANLSHSMVGAAVIFVGFHLAGRAAAEAVSWVLIATLGNLVGGIGLVTLFRFAQAREQAEQDERPQRRGGRT